MIIFISMLLLLSLDMLSKHRHVVATMRSNNERVTFWVDMIYRHQLMEFYSLLKMQAQNGRCKNWRQIEDNEGCAIGKMEILAPVVTAKEEAVSGSSAAVTSAAAAAAAVQAVNEKNSL